MSLSEHDPLTHIPILVEYRPYPGLTGKTTVRTDVAVKEALDSRKTLCEIAIEYCRAEGLDVTGAAHVSDLGIFAPSFTPCPNTKNCKSIYFGDPCTELGTCTQSEVRT